MGALFSTIDQSWPPSPKFKVEDIPDLNGKVMLVTGGNAGIGKETVKALLLHNAKVYLAARNKNKAEVAIQELKQETGKEAIFLELDLASLPSIKKAAEEFTSKEDRLHVLFNSAGVMVPPIGDLTAEGYDLQFGVNVLGHFYLTKLLLPTLIATAKDSPDGKSRVINTSSIGHLFHGLKFDSFKDGPARTKIGTQMLYCQSKCGNVVFARELARRYGDQGIVSTSVHPGNLKTDLQRNLPNYQAKLLNLILWPAPYGALTQLWGGTSPETVDLNGKYLIPWARVGKPSKESLSPEIGVKLWDWLEEQVGDL